MYSKKIFVAQRPYIMSRNPLLWFYGSSVYLSYFTTLVHSHKVLVVESWGRGSKGRVVFASKNSSAIIAIRDSYSVTLLSRKLASLVR